MVTWISGIMFNGGKRKEVHQYVVMDDPNHA